MLGAGLSVALAGCSDGDDRYWADPPSFDATGVDRVTERPLPERAWRLPVSVEPVRAEAAERIAATLATVPEPLDADRLPNGTIRTAITDARRAARRTLEQSASFPTPLARADAAVRARRHAARAAGIWAAVTVSDDPWTVVGEPRDGPRLVGDALGELPASGASPDATVVVSAPLERRLQDAREAAALVVERRDGETPLETGESAGKLETAFGTAAAARHVADRYPATVTDPQPAAEPLEAAVERLADPLARAVDSLVTTDYERAGPSDLRSVEEYLDRDPRRTPAVARLERLLDAMRDRLLFGPVPRRGEPSRYPALAIRLTHRSLIETEVIDRLGTRIENGDELFPPEAATVREARGAALDAVRAVGERDAVLDRWTSRRLRDRVAEIDRQIDEATRADTSDDRLTQTVARAHAEYVVVRLVARASPDATRVVSEQLDRSWPE